MNITSRHFLTLGGDIRNIAAHSCCLITSPQESSGLDTAAGHKWENRLNVLIPTKKEAYCSLLLGIMQLC